MSSVSAVPESGQISPKGRRRFTVDALFTDHRPQAVGVEDLPTAKEIRLERIEADPQQPRRTFDPDRLEELTASIRRTPRVESSSPSIGGGRSFAPTGGKVSLTGPNLRRRLERAVHDGEG